MPQINIDAELDAEYQWRSDEIAILKSLPIRRRFNPNEIEIHLKYATTAAYALWEGFVKTSFRLYIEALNRLNLSYTQILISITSNDLNIKHQFDQGRTNFERLCIFLEDIHGYMTSPILLHTSIPRKQSNIGFKVINQILNTFDMAEFPEQPYKSRLDELLHIRGQVAHGQRAVLNFKLLDDLYQTVIDSMVELIDRISTACRNESYLRI